MGQHAALCSKYLRLPKPASAPPVLEAPRDWSCKREHPGPCTKEARPMNYDQRRSQVPLHLLISTQTAGSMFKKKSHNLRNRVVSSDSRSGGNHWTSESASVPFIPKALISNANTRRTATGGTFFSSFLFKSLLPQRPVEGLTGGACAGTR